MKPYLLTKEFYIFLALFLSGTILYLSLRKLVPKIFIKATDKFRIDSVLIDELNGFFVSLLNLIYIVFILKLLIHIPQTAEQMKTLLDFNILDTEALEISVRSLVRGFIVFYLLLLLTRILRKNIQIYFHYKSQGEEIVSTVDILVYYTALIFIILITLSILGISWKLLIPIAGALGIGIGFGLQNIVNNFISGFVILLAKTVKRGDWITLGENFGKIVDIGIRTSTIRTLDNVDIIIPNSQLISEQLINWSYSDNIVRIHIPVGVSYSSDVNLVRETLTEVAKKADFILNSPSAEARFLEFGNSSLNFELLAWVDLRKTRIPLVKSNLNYMIWDAFKEKGIQIPFPQRDVWFRNEPKIQKETEEKAE